MAVVGGALREGVWGAQWRGEGKEVERRALSTTQNTYIPQTPQQLPAVTVTVWACRAAGEACTDTRCYSLSTQTHMEIWPAMLYT